MADVDQLMEQWWDELDRHAEEAQNLIRESLIGLTSDRSDVAGVGLMTDSGSETLVPVALSQSHLKKCASANPELAIFYAWCPDEWDIIPGPQVSTPIDSLRPVITALADSVSDNHWVYFTSLVCSWYVQQMEELREFFATKYPKANVVFWVTDNDEPVENIVEWVEQLNPSERAQPYVDWLRSQN